MSTEAMAPVPANDPMMIAWEAFKNTDEFANTRRWAAHDRHLDGSLWNCFVRGYMAASAGKQ